MHPVGDNEIEQPLVMRNDDDRPLLTAAVTDQAHAVDAQQRRSAERTVMIALRQGVQRLLTLRHLAVEDGRVRAARIAARKAQLAACRALLTKRSDAEIAAWLLVLERLCDAIAEGEFAAMDVSAKAARDLVIGAVRDALRQPSA